MDGSITGEVLTTITGMAGATKAIAEAFKLLKTKVKGNQEAERAVSSALDQILSLRSDLLDLQEKALSLQQELSRAQNENVKLREEIGREKKRTADLQQFHRKKVGHAVVMIREGEVDIFYCPSCLEKAGHAIPLQQIDHGEHSHMCFDCETVFSLEKF
jgi:TolA-binding protein